MSNAKIKLSVLGDGVTSTSILVHHCLRDRIELGDHVIDVSELDIHDFLRDGPQDGPLFMIRVASPFASRRITELVNSGKPYAYLIDDNFWLLLDQSPLDNFYKNWAVRKTLEAAISGASIVLCHSQHFKNFLLNYNNRVAIVPGYFDFECLKGLPEHLPEPGERRIGVVANASRASDLAIIVPAIQSIADQVDADVFFEFCGYIPPELVGHPKIRFFEPVSDYQTFIRMQYQRNWLLGLAPLQETPFSAYKSNNKFREFGGCRTAAIYSDVTVYRESVENGHTGWLVSNSTEAWRKQILEALANPTLVREIGENARAEVTAHYSINQVRETWISALLPVLDEYKSDGHKSRRPTFWSKLHSLSDKLLRRTTVLNIVTATGWRRRPLIVRDGFYNGQTLFNLEPGDSLVTELRAPVDGSFQWSLLVATFTTKPKGELTISFSGDGVVSQTRKYMDDEISDNTPYPIDVELHAGGVVTARICNKTDRPLGFYVLSPNGSTRFQSTGLAFSGRFLA